MTFSDIFKVVIIQRQTRMALGGAHAPPTKFFRRVIE